MDDDDDRLMTYDGEPINPSMGEGRFQDALRRLRDRIAGGLPLVLDDDNATGVHCSWGLCSLDAEQWPDDDDHVFPESHRKHLRVARRDLKDDTYCVHDGRPQKERSTWGCFFKCQMFHPWMNASTDRRPTREETIAALDAMIADREARLGRKITEDDHEPWRKMQAVAGKQPGEWLCGKCAAHLKRIEPTSHTLRCPKCGAETETDD